MNRMTFPNARGQDLVEYALILPIFVLLVFGILDLSRAVYYYSAMQNAAREGARYGSVHPDEVGVEATICNRVTSFAVGLYLLCDDVATTFNFVTGIVKVTVSYAFTPVTPLIESLIGAETITLQASSIMQLEYVP